MRVPTMFKLLVPVLAVGAAAWWYLGGFEAVIRLDEKAGHQTISGWSCIAPAWWGQEHLDDLGEEIFRQAYLDLGLTRFRLEVRSGSEAPVDENARLRRGEIEFKEYRRYWYRPINDDDDPRHFDWAGFQFGELDGAVEHLILPIRKVLAEQGRELQINLCYVSFEKQSIPSKVHHDPEEYAEFALANVLHLKEKYGIVPATWQVHLEPDGTPGWSGTALGNCVAATHRRFREAGLDIGLVGPSTTSAANAVPFLEAMLKVPGVKEAMAEFSYHRYRGVDDATLRGIAATAKEQGIRSAMLERIGAWHEVLHEDLERANVSSWMPYSLWGVGTAEKNDMGYYWIDRSDPEKPVLREHSKTRFMRQYLRYLRPGAKRFEAVSDEAACRPLAFRNADGKLAVVIDCKKAGRFRIEDLQPGRYVLEYSTKSERAKRGDPQVLEKPGAFVGSIPAAGVATLIQLD